jgi:ABC-type amino acid transport substrate-binding protein
MTLQNIKEDAQTIGFKGNLSHINVLVHMVFAKPQRVYEFMDWYGIDGDSFLREKIFTYIADKYYDGDYDKIYNEWLGV